MSDNDNADPKKSSETPQPTPSKEQASNDPAANQSRSPYGQSGEAGEMGKQQPQDKANDDAPLSDPLLIAETAAKALEGEVADLTDRLTRAHAEIQNLRRRHEKEQAEMAKYAIRKFAKDVVGVADNFARATAAVKPEEAEDNATVKGLLDGVAMTEREFLNILEKHGVQRIEADGAAFDPHKHQAMMEQEDPTKPSGTVLQVFQAGYEIADQVLRPAMVIVSKGGPKAAKPASDVKDDTRPKRPTLTMPGYDDEDEEDDDGAPRPIDEQM